MTIEDAYPPASFPIWAGPPARLSSRTAFAEAQAGEDPYSPIVHAPAGHPFLVAQLGQSLDGRIATMTGESKWINGRGAIDHLHRLRSLVDAVVVGVGTVIADDPFLTVRRVPGRSPARVVIDPAGRTPADARCFACDGTRRIVVTAGEFNCANGVEVIAMPRTNGKMNCGEIAEALFSRGLKRLLIEGGAATVSAFVDAGVIDRLHVLVAPLILGSGKIGLELSPVAGLADARRPKARVYQLAGGDVLFDCDMRTVRD
jgi:diaminohydroxyphosphoribosylaminopyrimidine deaminase / 5-amino-6-(5-phosphoribosylamino)uracil reductase